MAAHRVGVLANYIPAGLVDQVLADTGRVQQRVRRLPARAVVWFILGLTLFHGQGYRGVFAYIDGQLPGGVTLPLCRLRYNGSASIWGFAIYLASQDGYEDNVLPSGLPSGSPEEALDCACGLYLNDPNAR